MHWWVIALAWVLHHQQSITRSIVKCIYEPHRHLVADDLLSPRRKQMSSNLSLFLMLLLFLFSCRKFYCQNYEAKQQCLICDWVQIHCGFYRMSEVCQATSPLPTTARRMHCLPSRRQHSARRLPIKQDGLVYKFTFGWGWKPWQGRVIMIMS